MALDVFFQVILIWLYAGEEIFLSVTLPGFFLATAASAVTTVFKGDAVGITSMGWMTAMPRTAAPMAKRFNFETMFVFMVFVFFLLP